MLKKVIPIVLSLCLIFSISVMAENTTGNENIPNTSSEKPMHEEFDSSKMPQGDFDSSKMPEGFTPPEGGFAPPKSVENNNAETNEVVTEENPQPSENGEESGQTRNGNSPFGGQMPGGMGGFPGNMQNNQQSQEETPMTFSGFVKTYSTPITSVILLVLAFIFVIFYRRKNY